MLLEETNSSTYTGSACESRQPQVDSEMQHIRKLAEKINTQTSELSPRLGKLIIGNMLSRPSKACSSEPEELCELAKEMRVVVNILDEASEFIDAILNGLEISSLDI